MGSFSDAIGHFAAKVERQADEVTRGSIMEVGRRVIARSPIKKGTFVSNWNYGLETPDDHTTTATSIRELNNLDEMPRQASKFVHFISNAMAYGPLLERGSSKQAPQGMVGLTAMEWTQIVAGQVAKLAR